MSRLRRLCRHLPARMRSMVCMVTLVQLCCRLRKLLRGLASSIQWSRWRTSPPKPPHHHQHRRVCRLPRRFPLWLWVQLRLRPRLRLQHNSSGPCPRLRYVTVCRLPTLALAPVAVPALDFQRHRRRSGRRLCRQSELCRERYVGQHSVAAHPPHLSRRGARLVSCCGASYRWGLARYASTYSSARWEAAASPTLVAGRLDWAPR